MMWEMDAIKKESGRERERRRYRQANFDLRFCNSSIRTSSCCRARSFAFRSSSSRCSRDCFSWTTEFRTVTTSRLVSSNSVRRDSIFTFSVSRSRASSVACMRALRTEEREKISYQDSKSAQRTYDSSPNHRAMSRACSQGPYVFGDRFHSASAAC